MHVHVETPRLSMRRFTADDVDVLVELDSDPEVVRFLTGGRVTPREEVENDVLPAFLGYYDRFAGYGFWAAHERATGAFIGWFHLRPAPGHPDDEPELGYRLRQAAWGRGYATEGSQALLDKAFTEGASRIVAETMVAHSASRRVMEKCGMTVARVFHQEWPYPIPGDEQGDVEYELTREQWRSRTQPKE